MFSFFFQGLAALRLLGHVSAAEVQQLTLLLPAERPPWSEKLSPSLAGFSIEMDRWPDWAGREIGKPNKYFNQLLQNLGDRTGQMPTLRVGANSQDRGTVDLRVKVMNATFPKPSPDIPNPEADHIYIGRDFYALSGNLPMGTEFMWGLNFKALNKTETLAQARLLGDTFQGSRSELTKHVRLAQVELGNEPDFWGETRYSRSGSYGPEWDIQNYTNTWVSFAKAVSEEIDFGPSQSRHPCLSSGAYTGFNIPEWQPEGSLIGGILADKKLKGKISQFTEHSYSGGYSAGKTFTVGDLMNKRAAETNSYANHGIPGLSNTVEGALWMVDWILLGASIGVERLYMHHGVGFRYNSIQPTNESDDGLNIDHPHILPSYHAYLIVNEAIGKSAGSYIVELPTTNITLTAYGIWESSKLVRIVVLNTQVHTQGEKSSIQVSMKGLGTHKPATVKLLESEKTNSSIGITWAGQSFETSSGAPEGEIKVKKVKDGSFNLPASSIALVEFGKHESKGYFVG
uniref:Beta-glucuronidase C-terminal domain-containing protein n=1 Tax=Fusarium oxysporum (strain Fo5176) TaxID=660025 RepID=A0A0D2XRG6_FUSOF